MVDILPQDTAQEQPNTNSGAGVRDAIAEARAEIQQAETAGVPPVTPEPVATRFDEGHLTDTVADEVLLGRYRWVPGLEWLQWTGKYWKPVLSGEVREAIRLWALEQFRRASLLEIEASARGDDAEARRWSDLRDSWKSVLSKAKLTSLTELASQREGIITDPELLDNQPHLLNAQNGVVDLRSGEFWAHDEHEDWVKSLLFTKIAGCAYRPDAKHPDWAKALRALPEDVLGYFQLRLGQGITGEPPRDDVLPVCWGGGANGKSTIMAGVAGAIGDFFTLVSDRVLLASVGQHPTELMELRGARLAFIEETPEERHLNVQRLKKVLGTPYIEARLIRKDSVTFKATHTLIVNTNYKPMIEQTDHGTWRRLQLVRFPYTFSPGDDGYDPTLRQRVQQGGDAGEIHEAVLAWLVQGAMEWYRLGGVMPEAPKAIQEDTARWRRESDIIYTFWEDVVEPAPGYHVTSKELLEAMNELLAEHGARPWGSKTFNARFGDHDLTRAAQVHVLSSPVMRDYPGNAGILSRKPALVGAPLAQTYRAWWGLKFRGSN